MPIVVQRSKRYKKAAKKAIADAGRGRSGDRCRSRRFTPTKFDQSVELIFSLGIDPKQADQMIRGSLSLPHGVGKTKRVVAFCPDHLAAASHRRRRDQGRRAGTGRRRSRRKTSPISTSPSPRRT